MNMESPDITFTAKIWLYESPKAAWHFITVPVEQSAQLRFYASDVKAGWGSIPVNVRIGTTQWKTSVFPDKKTKTYLLPIKADVRKAEGIGVDQMVEVVIRVGG